MKSQSIGKRIREARKSAGMTQCQLADLVFVSESYIALIESGRRNPSMHVLTKIAEVLHLTTDGLVFDTESRDIDSFTSEWKKLIENRTPTEIQSALVLLKTYFSCLDDNIE